jgi:gliding motility-associated-like protein
MQRSCNGAVELSISGGTPMYSYSWNTGSHANDVGNLMPGDYAVTVTDNNGCSASANFTVSTDYVLEVHATGATTINEGESTTVSATANVDHNNVFNWTPGEYVICSNCSSTLVAPASAETYTVLVTDANGCKASDVVVINVNQQNGIYVPNAFSPNGDGNNDYFQVFGNLSPIVYFDMLVFDRWGEKVFESQDPNFKWDGTYKGQPAPMGVFIYAMTASFEDGSHRDFKGSLTLVR